MLARIHINNLAVIDEVELEFESGMTALTGETGAGKSILVDALALALGERADSKAVRTGTDRCTVTATFDIKEAGHVTRWLQAHDLDADDECIIRRVVSADGRSRGYLNGNNVPMQTLRDLEFESYFGLKGGVLAWRAEGFPLIVDSPDAED